MSNIKDIKLSTVGEDDRPDLEGKIVNYHFGSKDGYYSKSFKGIVVGCNRSLGITVVNLDDKDHYLVCIQGASAPGGATSVANGKSYEELHDFVVAQIEAGDIYSADCIQMQRGGPAMGFGPDGSNCAYRQ